MSSRKKGILIFTGIAAITLMLGVLLSQSRGRDEEHQHFYMENILKEATCDKPGKAEYVCPGCGDSYIEKLPRKGHVASDAVAGDGLIHTGKCANCGEEINVMRDAETGIIFTAPEGTRDKRATVTVTNSAGFRYVYVIYLQGGGFNNYSHYLRHHGCSTCALTSVLNAVVPELENYTPDRVIEEIERKVFGKKAFFKNFYTDKNKGKMPVSLYGMTKIFDEYGVRYGLPSADPDEHEAQITEHLKNGDPVIVTFSKGGAGGLSNGVHTIDLLGIDSDGYVIIGDSLHKKSKDWGINGLVKPGKITVSDILSYIRSSGGWSISSDRFGDTGDLFYHSKADRGFLLVYGSDN